LQPPFLYTRIADRKGADLFMAKVLDLKKTVYELVQEHPELVHIMAEFGFSSITNPAVLKTAGRVMTLPKGAAMKGKDLEEIKAELAKRGYTVIN
jgi:hypothetical protein